MCHLHNVSQVVTASKPKVLPPTFGLDVLVSLSMCGSFQIAFQNRTETTCEAAHTDMYDVRVVEQCSCQDMDVISSFTKMGLKDFLGCLPRRRGGGRLCGAGPLLAG